MADTDEKYCSNCKRNIASGNFLMHSVHCQRNISLCKRCNEPVPNSEMEEHLNNFHSKMSCSRCGKLIEQWELEEHEGYLCPKRIISCHYCELECPSDELGEHESYCGSRTEICSFCRQYVMIKNKNEHSKNQCKIKQKELKDEIETSPADTLIKSGTLNNRALHRTSKEKLRRKDTKNNVTKQNLFDNPNGGTTQLNNNTSEVRDSTESSLNEDISTDAILDNPENLDDLLALQLTNEEADIDELLSALTPWSSSNYYYPVLPHLMYNNSDEFIIPVESRNESSSDTGESVNLPCEFCEELFPEDILIQHQSGCRPDIAHGTHPWSDSEENLEKLPSSHLMSEDIEKTSDVPQKLCNEMNSADLVAQQPCSKTNIQDILPSDAKYPPIEIKSSSQNRRSSSPPFNRRMQKHQPDPSFNFQEKFIDRLNKNKNKGANEHAFIPLPDSLGKKSNIKENFSKNYAKVNDRPVRCRNSKLLEKDWVAESTKHNFGPMKNECTLSKKYTPTKYSSERTGKNSGRLNDQSSNETFYQYLEEMKVKNLKASDLKRKPVSSGARPKHECSSLSTATNLTGTESHNNQGLGRDSEGKNRWRSKPAYQQEDRNTRPRIGNRNDLPYLDLTASQMTLLSQSPRVSYISRDKIRKQNK